MIHHVTREIPPAAIERCVAFYGLIGFARVEVPAGIGGRAIWLEQGTTFRTQIHLMPNPDATPQSGHIGIVCRDFAQTLDRLERERPPEERRQHPVTARNEHWGSPRVYVRDPAGNLVELMAWPPHEA